jgi:AcrR family transcriptional regulator
LTDGQLVERAASARALPRERSDAARNRRAILAATEELLAAGRPQDISIDQVAAAAGVAKGTVFHRFGNRMGLMTALMIERARALNDAVSAGPPPLGPGAPDRDRLLAFLDAMAEVVSRNKSLLAELAHSGALEPAPPQEKPHDDHPVYWFWHGHISALIASQRPDADADTIAHILLGSLHSEPVLAQLTDEGPGRVAAALRSLAAAILDA